MGNSASTQRAGHGRRVERYKPHQDVYERAKAEFIRLENAWGMDYTFYSIAQIVQLRRLLSTQINEARTIINLRLQEAYARNSLDAGHRQAVRSWVTIIDWCEERDRGLQRAEGLRRGGYTGS